MTTRTEFGVARTVCACAECKAHCRFMPGYLIAADLERLIPAHASPLAWADNNLLASPGALVVRRGKLFRIPTLVPGVKRDGSCIHFTPDERCAVHPLAPFGCAFFDHRDTMEDQRGLGQQGLLAVLAAWHDPASLYRQIWERLYNAGRVQYASELLLARKASAKLPRGDRN